MIVVHQEINGFDYEFVVGRNYVVGENIKGNYDGFSLFHSTNGFVSEIFLKSSNPEEPTKKIGSLLYDSEGDIVTYRKHIKLSEHEFHTTESIGINNVVLSNLCPKDKILIFEHIKNKTYVYSISVRKAILKASYMTFGGYEKQAFIPKSEFKMLEEKEKKKRSRNGKRKSDKTNK